MADVGSYLYAVARGVSATDLASVRGLDDHPVRVVEHRGLSAIVSDVDLEVYGDQGLREHLEDLAWLESVARTHDAVVFATSVQAPTAPLRLATICLTDEGVRDRLDLWHEPLMRAIERIAGRQEWSVKAIAPALTPESAESASTGPVGEREGDGAAYLRRRKDESARRQRDEEESGALGDALHTELAAEAAASRRLAPQDQRLSGYQGSMILNGAYLVDEVAGRNFHSTVQALREAHPSLEIELQGPWPAYSFVSLEGEASPEQQP